MKHLRVGRGVLVSTESRLHNFTILISFFQQPCCHFGNTAADIFYLLHQVHRTTQTLLLSRRINYVWVRLYCDSSMRNNVTGSWNRENLWAVWIQFLSCQGCFCYWYLLTEAARLKLSALEAVLSAWPYFHEGKLEKSISKTCRMM